jgi:hypothetical protein
MFIFQRPPTLFRVQRNAMLRVSKSGQILGPQPLPRLESHKGWMDFMDDGAKWHWLFEEPP